MSTTTVEGLIRRQEAHFHTIHRFLDNFKKLGKAKATDNLVRNRLAMLQTKWNLCVETNAAIYELATDADRQRLSYFEQGQFDSADDAYMTAADYLSELLSTEVKQESSSSLMTSTCESGSPHPTVRLPRIDLPKFSGAYTDWENFRDMFRSIVAENDSLTKVQKLHYLKASLTGEASHLVKNLAITDANYTSAWNAISDRYENERVLIHSHIRSFCELPVMTTSSSTDLKFLRDSTAESLAALTNLKRPVETWDDLLIYLVSAKFDQQTRESWENHLGNTRAYPKYSQLVEFLDTRIRVLESVATTHRETAHNPLSTKKLQSKVPKVKAHHTSVTKTRCILCQGDHAVTRCEKYKAMNVSDRLKAVRELKCCGNCLRPGHLPKDCPSKGRCFLCAKPHHTSLHIEPHLSPSVSSTTITPSTLIHREPENTVALHTSRTIAWPKQSVLLASSWIKLYSNNGKTRIVRALLDQGAECSFVTESVAQFLQLPRRRVNVTISVVNESVASVARSSVVLVVGPTNSTKPSISLEALVIPKITSYRPAQSIQVSSWSHLNGLSLADPLPSSTYTFDVLLGADVYGSILREGLKAGSPDEPIAQNTIFGWVISGPTSVRSSESSPRVVHHIAIDELDKTLRRFWEIEDMPRELPLTPEERQCEEHFKSTFRRDSDGRYIVRLPFNQYPPVLGNSLAIAQRCLTRLEHQFARDRNLYSAYREFFKEYLRLGHMELCSDNDLGENSEQVYLPHHPVIRETSTTTRVRAVFNASCRTTNGTSLNDALLIGPKLQIDLAQILMRWRMHRYAFTADIQQMYRQIKIDPRDANYQCIVWRDFPTRSVESYRLLTVTYGSACAPFLALRTLKQLDIDEGMNFPLASFALKKGFYVDDVLWGADTIEIAKQTRDELISLLNKGKFRLRKWMSNHPDLVNDLPFADRESQDTRLLTETSSIKILGILWDPQSDCFRFNSTSESNHSRTSKREILSHIARLFDPLGWLAPFVIRAKILLQELWMRQIGWDDEIPDDIISQWKDYRTQLEKIREISIPRWTEFSPSCSNVEIHGFADASLRAYAAVVYLRILEPNLHARVHLITSKTKVSPIKSQSIPRLELCAAVLLARLISCTCTTLGFENIPIHAWTDSSVVLAWISRHPSSWKTFVANRVSDIQTLIPGARWHHVPTSFNPADCASRGIPVQDLINSPLWWTGPEWLSKPSAQWPSRPLLPCSDEIHSEHRKSANHTHFINTNEISILDRFSSWPRLLRVIAFCLRFIRVTQQCSPKIQSSMLTSEEISKARIKVIRLLQNYAFCLDLRAIQMGKPVRSQSLLKLAPFVDKDGILRVGGRLQQSFLPFNEKHPIILPKHKISELIIVHAHMRCLHGGTQLTLRLVRQECWILGARNLVKRVIHSCIQCVRERRTNPSQLMAELPQARVTPSRPFSHCGVDYAGPVLIRDKKGRGSRSTKAYIAIFVCFATRAVHIELVSDYSSNAFLAALRRFTSRRGIPSNLYSDNGTTFLGADKELQRSVQAVLRSDRLASSIADYGIRWNFIPPSAPHFGGLWEAGVKSIKHHLRRVVGAHSLTFEELTTVLTQIEAVLNSRPIAPMTDDPLDTSVLTPGHFLIGAPLCAIPEPSVLEIAENRLSRYQLIQRMLEQMWRLWSADYLNSLQQRHRWFRDEPNLRVGDIVLLKSNLNPPSKWLLGRVVTCHPGRDNRTRVVTVKTATATYTRPISQVCLLPVRSAEDSPPLPKSQTAT